MGRPEGVAGPQAGARLTIPGQDPTGDAAEAGVSWAALGVTMILLAPVFAATPPPIINGEAADETVYPMSGATIVDVMIDYGRESMQYKGMLCSSTLIAPDVVLLAAHCLDPVALTYGYGDVTSETMGWTRQSDLSRWDGSSTPSDWPSDIVMATDWVWHERFSMYTLEVGIAENYDVGLVFLEEALTDVEPAVLVTEEEATQIEEGDVVDIVGWGQQQQQSRPGTYAYKYWGVSTIGEIGPPEFQVGPDADDVRKCHGDSGGPTFMIVETDSPEKTRQIGVTSHAYDNSDCSRTGGVDTRIDHHLAWIDEQMRAACDDGTRVWCDEAGILAPPEAETDDPGPDDSGDSGVADEDGDGIADDEELEVAGCACDTAATKGWAGLPALLLLGWRRRSARGR